MKENNMKTRHNRVIGQGEKSSLIQTRPTPCASHIICAKPLTGKVFYLDLASNRVAETLESDIKDLGGTVEKFFSKEIKYLVSNKREAKYVQCLRQDSPIPSPESGPSSPQACSSPHQLQSHEDSTKSTSQPQKDAVTTSRGKSLVKRVVKEQEKIHMNKILSNALDWGVKILYLDDVIAYVNKKKKSLCSQQPAINAKINVKAESTKRVCQKSKGGRINKPFVKVEDSSKHYRPFYLSLTNIPEFNLTTAPPCTPFCAEDKPAPGNMLNGQRDVRASASDERPANDRRKKKKQGGYCECCLMKYDNVSTHLQSDRHKTFAKSEEYQVVDKLVSAMRPNFTHVRSKLKRRKCSVSSVLIAPGPYADNHRHKGKIDCPMNFDMPQSPCNNERRVEQCTSELGSKPSCPAVPDRKNKRKQCTFSDSEYKPKQPCPDSTAEGKQSPHSNGDFAPPTGDSAAVHRALSEVQLSDQGVPASHRSEASETVKVQTKIFPETKMAQQESSLCGAVHKQLNDICVYQTYNSSEEFVPEKRIQRKLKVYKRKKRKLHSPVASEREQQRDSADEGLMRLWELFQASDDMDLEFYGFE